jgi:photosystem II stability/assembly factor-like uncharacterized protein
MESVLYIGTDSGVLTARSTDQKNWKIVEHGLKQWEVCEVAVAPDAPNKVFAGTRGDGVWVSEDFGKSWKKPCYGKRGPGKVRAVTIDPNNPKRIYAGCEPIDVWVSEDEAKSWTRFDSIWDIPFIATVPYPVATVEPHVRDVTVDPSDSKTVYASLQVGYIVKTTDGGKTWNLLNNALDCDVHTIVVDPKNSKHIVVSTGGHDHRLGRAPGRSFYVSDDAGNSWTPVGMNFTEEYSVPMTADPHNPKLLYSALAKGQPGQWRRRDSGAEAVLVRSTDGGKNWSPHTKGLVTKDYPEVILVDEKNPGRLYTACRNGDFFTSENAGEDWQSMSFGLKVDDLSSLALAHV